MSEKSSSQILPLLEVGQEVLVKEFEDIPFAEGVVQEVGKDYVSLLLRFNGEGETEYAYAEIYDEKIDELIVIYR